MKNYTKKIIVSILGLLLIVISQARAEGWSDEQIADAIYLAESGKKAVVPYGILSIKVKDEAEARRICINTIRSNRIRFKLQIKYNDFIEFLGSKYTPIGAENDPKGLNKNWVKNVKWFLENKGE